MAAVSGVMFLTGDTFRGFEGTAAAAAATSAASAAFFCSRLAAARAFTARISDDDDALLPPSSSPFPFSRPGDELEDVDPLVGFDPSVPSSPSRGCDADGCRDDSAEESVGSFPWRDCDGTVAIRDS